MHSQVHAYVDRQSNETHVDHTPYNVACSIRSIRMLAIEHISHNVDHSRILLVYYFQHAYTLQLDRASYRYDNQLLYLDAHRMNNNRRIIVDMYCIDMMLNIYVLLALVDIVLVDREIVHRLRHVVHDAYMMMMRVDDRSIVQREVRWH